MAIAALHDATLVRVVATPAVFQLIGRANWWFPRLERAVPNLLATGTLHPMIADDFVQIREK